MAAVVVGRERLVSESMMETGGCDDDDVRGDGCCKGPEI